MNVFKKELAKTVINMITIKRESKTKRIFVCDQNLFHFVFIKLTLYPPRSSTMHVNNASRPTGTVTFKIGALNLGSAET